MGARSRGRGVWGEWERFSKGETEDRRPEKRVRWGERVTMSGKDGRFEMGERVSY
jgi:hypothetical protein